MHAVEFPTQASRRIWYWAAVGAVVIHAACAALAIEYMQPDDPEDAAGAVAIEIGFELAAPRRDPSDLPPGPDAEASEAAPEVVAQQAVVEENNLPKAQPTETEEPDQIVSLDDPKEVKDDEQKVTTMQATPSTSSVAAEATAAPSSDVIPEAPRSTTPAQGVGESARRVRTTWQKELIAHFDRHKRYPSDRSRQAAEIVVGFSLDRTGRILSTTIVRGSGDPSFDQAALTMLRRSDPVPAPPPLVADEGLSFTLPVIFRIKGRN